MRGCCDPTGSEALQKAFKKALAERGLNRRMRANKSRCLDQWEKGPSVVVYPQNVWYGRVTEGHVNEIVEEHLIGGRPVKRLLMPEDPPIKRSTD